jgi:dienelactone hydrolase
LARECAERKVDLAARLLAAAALLLWCGAAAAQELVHFPSSDDNGPGQPATVLDGYLLRPAGDGRHPAVVFLHGCGGLFGGLFDRMRGLVEPGERDWADELTRRGYVVLMVDSFRPRDRGEQCSPRDSDPELYRKRPRDAYGALLFLQTQPFVRPDRVAVIGWSQGGGAVLLAIGAQGIGRPAQLPQGDFRAAVAFYPTSCNTQFKGASWTSAIPLLVLVGAGDVLHPAAACKEFLDGAAARGATVEIQIYPGAYHHFDWPDVPRHELPALRNAAGAVPIYGTDPAARQDAFSRVPAFLGRYLPN